MNKGILFALPVLLFSAGIMQYSYAQTFDGLSANVLDYDGDSARVQLSWDLDESASKYSVGCVSCMPNTVQSTTASEIIVDDVVPFPNSSNAMLYVIAYDSEDELIKATQIILNLEE